MSDVTQILSQIEDGDGQGRVAIGVGLQGGRFARGHPLLRIGQGLPHARQAGDLFHPERERDGEEGQDDDHQPLQPDDPGSVGSVGSLVQALPAGKLVEKL